MTVAHNDRSTRLPPMDDQHIIELRTALGHKKLGKLLLLLAADLPKRAATIRGNDRDGDLSVLLSELHNIKGMAASFGLQRVAMAAAVVEGCDRGMGLDNALERLETEVIGALACLSQWPGGEAASPAR